MNEPQTPAVIRFIIYPPRGDRDYRVSLGGYNGGEVVNAAAYDALLTSHRELFSAASAVFAQLLNYGEISNNVARPFKDALANAEKLILPHRAGEGS